MVAIGKLEFVWSKGYYLASYYDENETLIEDCSRRAGKLSGLTAPR